MARPRIEPKGVVLAVMAVVSAIALAPFGTPVAFLGPVFLVVLAFAMGAVDRSHRWPVYLRRWWQSRKR
jgi:hypothetical protein